MEVVGEAGDGESAWREVKELRPDIVIMDVSMPQMNGALATERLKVDCPEVKVVALSAHADEVHVRHCWRQAPSVTCSNAPSPKS
jgi:DNA-binding NarL/FixJ family response regulator